MNKAQKVIIIFLAISLLVIVLLTTIYFNKQKNNENTSEICNPTAYRINEINASISSSEKIIFYYGSTCPHCKLVEDFMKNNSIESKIKISQREVYGNQTAAKEMMDLQRLGNLPSGYVGAVPILYNNKTIYVGDKDIICILKSLTGNS